MSNSKFLKILFLLSKNEQQQFCKWIQFSFSAKKANKLVDICHELIKKQAEEEVISKQMILHLIRQGKFALPISKEEDKAVRNVLHILYNSLRDFLAWKKYKISRWTENF